MATGARKLMLYLDMASQPCRAIGWFCHLANIPHSVQLIEITKGETRSPEFIKINPNRKVPVIDDDGFVLNESHAIMKYLHKTRNVSDSWYPRHDDKKQALIDAHLDWHHSVLRVGAAGYFQQTFLFPKIFGQPVNEKAVEDTKKTLTVALKTLERGLEAHPFLFGDEPTIADLSSYEELCQLKVLNQTYDNFPKVAAWMNRMQALPFYDQIHKKINAMANRAKL